ncbi:MULTISPECIES: 50S ribosomal protein L22 [Chryseobacterium]|uniref:50S ribosomal protein L22 n=1 Tax=Chryseobacterium sp. R2A-55 TaxID=2744445 RepID=UPI001F1E6812|nr:50S ribosomal protein L22 [Chryseobacterium sp. R2A-55]
MGSRKRESALARKIANQDVVKALHNDCPSSPRKMRLVADIIRGVEVDKALAILKFSKKDASNKLEKVLLSAMANWQTKNEGADIEEAGLIVKEIHVDSARQLKRLRPAPQGRGYRIRKRSNHITLILGTKDNK